MEIVFFNRQKNESQIVLRMVESRNINIETYEKYSKE